MLRRCDLSSSRFRRFDPFAHCCQRTQSPHSRLLRTRLAQPNVCFCRTLHIECAGVARATIAWPSAASVVMPRHTLVEENRDPARLPQRRTPAIASPAVAPCHLLTRSNTDKLRGFCSGIDLFPERSQFVCRRVHPIPLRHPPGCWHNLALSLYH